MNRLQILTKENKWEAVPQMKDCFIVNVGDQLKMWTNDIYQSPVHRVVNTTGRERYSVAFFLGPDYDALIECLPTCLKSLDEKPKHEPSVWGPYLFNKFTQTYLQAMQDRENAGK